MSQAEQTSPIERRTDPRIETQLSGRYMMPDQREYPCNILDIALNGVCLSGEKQGEIGEKVIVYIEHLGRVEGEITRLIEGGFALELTMSPAARNKWADRVETLSPELTRGSLTDRKEVRVEPEHKRSRFTLPDGRNYACEVIDMSISGASIKVSVFPAIGTPVQLGKMRGKVVRHHIEGVAIEFVNVPETGTLADRFKDIKL